MNGVSHGDKPQALGSLKNKDFSWISHSSGLLTPDLPLLPPPLSALAMLQLLMFPRSHTFTGKTCNTFDYPIV